MSSQRGNVKKSGPPKHQNKKGWKNVYHDTSKRTKDIINTEVSGVCSRCKDIIDWKIKYKKYKPLTQPKTCVSCKHKTVKQAYNVYCLSCSTKQEKCSKCGEKKDIVLEPSMSAGEQAAEDRQFQFELEQLSERKRRTFLRLQEKGLLTESKLKQLQSGLDSDLDFSDFDDEDDECSDGDDSDIDGEEEGGTNVVKPAVDKDISKLKLTES